MFYYIFSDIHFIFYLISSDIRFMFLNIYLIIDHTFSDIYSMFPHISPMFHNMSSEPYTIGLASPRFIKPWGLARLPLPPLVACPAVRPSLQ